MNQTVSEKLTVDYLFVVDNSEPKQFIYYTIIDITGFIVIMLQKMIYKNFTFPSPFHNKRSNPYNS